MDDAPTARSLAEAEAPPALQRDFAHVAKLAIALLDRVEKANTRLDPQIEAALKEMLRGLAHLPDGLWREAKAPLEAATEFLPEIRSEYLPTEIEAADRPTDESPPLQRHEGWDDTLRDLIGEVVTAHRALLRALSEPEPPPSHATDVTGVNAMAAASAAALSQNFAVQTEAAAQEVGEIAISTSVRAIALRRALWSSAIIGRAASAIFSLPRVLADKARTLYRAASGLSGILRGLVDGIERLEDIGAPGWATWQRIRKRIKQGILESYEDVKRAIRETADVIQPLPPINSKDREAAEARVREAILAGRRPTAEDIALAETLDLSAEAISSDQHSVELTLPNPGLIGLCENLKTLKLQNRPLSEIGWIIGLHRLEQIELSGSKVTDLAPIANLTALRNLFLNGTQVADIEPIANLTALETLWLNRTQVADLAPIANLTALETLWLNGTQVADLAPIANLAALRELALRGAKVTDWAPVDHVDDVEGRPADWPRVK